MGILESARLAAAFVAVIQLLRTYHCHAEVFSCYSTKEITLGLCAHDDHCGSGEECDRKVCVDKHTLATTQYETGTIDTIIDKWPPLSKGNGLPLTENCEPPNDKGCFITRYVDWPPETNTHIATSENAGFRGGCSDGYHEYDGIDLEEGYFRHSNDVQTVTMYCTNAADCNEKWDKAQMENLGVYDGARQLQPTPAPLLCAVFSAVNLIHYNYYN